MWVFSLLLMKAVFSVDYCSIEGCYEPKKHVICIYPVSYKIYIVITIQIKDKHLTTDCELTSTLIDENVRLKIVELHNEFRNNFMNGTRFNPASDMLEMVIYYLKKNNPFFLSQSWDFELELLAQRNADNCLEHFDDCVAVERYKNIGQNIDVDSNLNIIEMPKRWFNESNIYNSSKLNPYEFTLETGRFSQAIWSRNYLIGCGASGYKRGSKEVKYLVCNYGPGGNVEGEYLYWAGEPCTHCPMNSECSKFYNNLCVPKLTDDDIYYSKPISGEKRPLPNILILYILLDLLKK